MTPEPPLVSAAPDLPSTCPLCGNPMVRGSMRLFAPQGACGLIWLDAGEKPTFIAPKDSILAERRPFRPGDPAEVPGWIYRTCKVVVGRYPGPPP